MNLDLTPQLIHDHEELRRKSALEIERLEAEVRRLKEEVEPLEAEVKRLKEEVQRLVGEVESLKREVTRLEGVVEPLKREVTRLEAEVKRLNGEVDPLKREIKRLNGEVDPLKREVKRLNGEVEPLREEVKRLKGEVEPLNGEVKRLKGDNARLSAALKAETAKKQAELDRIRSEYMEELETFKKTHAGELDESKLVKVVYMPLGMRVTALIVDVLLLAIVSAKLRFGTAWGQELSSETFIVGIFSVFFLRTFVSPGRLLLGISPRHIGPDLRPTGPAGFTARLFCGLSHYGPLVATAFFVASDAATTRAWMKLVEWAYHPLTSTQAFSAILVELIKPEAPAPPGVVLALTLVWWALLLVSILFSPLIYMGTPYFRNTTLVESMWRVGFQRFSLPQPKLAEIEVSA